ncbi:MAG: hypothetical protein WKF57_04135 [Nakamurella sp.]
MTRTDDLPENLENTEQRIRAAMTSEAGSVTEADLRRRLLTDRAEHRPRRRQRVMLAAASAVIVLGGAVTVLSIRSGSADRVAEPSTPSPATIMTLSALPDSPWSCPYTGFKEYGQEAAQQGGGLVTGVLRPTGVHREEVDQQAGGYYSEVQIIVTSVLTGQLSTGEVTGYVESGIDTTAAPPPDPSHRKLKPRLKLLTSTTAVDRGFGRVVAGQGGQRVIMVGCEDKQERRAGRASQDRA